MKDLSDAAWEELAQREPYFRVLTHDGLVGASGNRSATDAFFETGEADITVLLAAIAPLVGDDLPLTSTLDFGCGAGRLTLPLARRSTRVTACDVAPTMLAHVRRNALAAGLDNVTFVMTGELAGLDAGQFDFVCSLLVFQYIRPAIGHAIIRTLLRLLAPAGVAALHLPLERRGARLRRFARTISTATAPAELNEYHERTVDNEIATAGARVIGRFPMHHAGDAGMVLVIQKNLLSIESD